MRGFLVVQQLLMDQALGLESEWVEEGFFFSFLSIFYGILVDGFLKSSLILFAKIELKTFWQIFLGASQTQYNLISCITALCHYYLQSVQSSYLVQCVDTRTESSMKTKYLVIHQCCQRHIIKNIGEIFPHRYISIFL